MRRNPFSTLRILVIAIIALVSYLSPSEAVADSKGDIVLVPDNSDKKNPGKEIPRMPARPVIATYGDGVFAVPEWPYGDEPAHLAIVTADGAAVVDLDCSGADLSAGIYIGRFDSFTVTLTTASGVTLTGTF